MFTGIVQHVGVVRGVRPAGGGARLTIDIGPLTAGLALGASVAVNGACLTAARIDGAAAEFDVVAESLRSSTLGGLRAGSRVNLERAMAADARFDGHIVQGHVDGVAKVARVNKAGEWLVEFTAGADLTALMVRKGSVALDGVSLTLAGVSGSGFSVALIPTTLAGTTLADLAAGQAVNVEADVVGKYVRAFLERLAGSPGGGGLTLDKLRDAGFA